MTSLGRMTPSELPNLRILSSIMFAPRCYYNCNYLPRAWQQESDHRYGGQIPFDQAQGAISLPLKNGYGRDDCGMDP